MRLRFIWATTDFSCADFASVSNGFLTVFVGGLNFNLINCYWHKLLFATGIAFASYGFFALSDII